MHKDPEHVGCGSSRGFCWLSARGARPTGVSKGREWGERGAHWGGTVGTSEGLGGRRCPVQGNGILMEKSDRVKVTIPILLLS